MPSSQLTSVNNVLAVSMRVWYHRHVVWCQDGGADHASNCC